MHPVLKLQRPLTISRRLALRRPSYVRYASSATSVHPQKFAYGLLASVAFFSAALGYSANEYVRRQAKDGSRQAATWKDASYGSRSDVEAAITELKRILPREGAVDTVRPASNETQR